MAPAAPKAGKPEQVEVRALNHDFLHLHQNVHIPAGTVKPLVLDPFLQAQLDAGRCELVTN